jgi:hydroxyacylglutathione hydrolase
MVIKTIGLGFVNTYLIEVKDGFVLIDTGVPFQWEKLNKALKAAGCQPGNLKLVVITHGDIDHIGSGAKLQAKYQAKIALHQGDAFMAETGAMLTRMTRTLSAKIRAPIMGLARVILGPRIAIETFKPDEILKDGQSLEEYGLDAVVVHIPGHTKGSIGILTKDGDLFCGDTLVNRNKPETAIYIEDGQEQKNSIDKLMKMNIRKVYPGHGKPFDMKELKLSK